MKDSTFRQPRDPSNTGLKPLIATSAIALLLSGCGDIELPELPASWLPADNASTPAATPGGSDATAPQGSDGAGMNDTPAAAPDKPTPPPAGEPAPAPAPTPNQPDDTDGSGSSGGDDSSQDGSDPATGDMGDASDMDDAADVDDNGDADANTLRNDILAQVNALRAAGAVCGSQEFPAAGPLQWNDQLELAAFGHSEFMQQTETFSHTGRDNSSPAKRLSDTGYEWRIVGENIAAGYNTVDAVMQGWMDSPGHCRNIMNDSFTEIAVSLVEGTDQNTYSKYWTMTLASPFDAAQ